MESMSQAEYARHLGVSRQQVSKDVKAGKIPVGADGRINPADADFARRSSRVRVNTPAEPPEAPASYGPAETSGLTKARTATEVYRARLAQLEYDERLGKLRPVDDIMAAAQACADQLVRALDQLPRRADEIAAAARAEDVAGVRVLLKTIVRDIRRLAADEFAKLAAGAAPNVAEDSAE
jgi:hypothetical protein